jgi:hypothetical protein
VVIEEKYINNPIHLVKSILLFLSFISTRASSIKTGENIHLYCSQKAAFNQNERKKPNFESASFKKATTPKNIKSTTNKYFFTDGVKNVFL